MPPDEYPNSRHLLHKLTEQAQGMIETRRQVVVLVQVAVANSLRTSTPVTESGSTVNILLEKQTRCSVFTFQTSVLGHWFLQIIF